MPVHPAGPRIFHSIKFKHLVKHSGSATSARSSNISLNLTPFVDMMTILVTFLLMVFSAQGELIQAQKGLELPLAERKDILQKAPVITVTQTEVSFDGQGVSSVDSILRDEAPRIDVLLERMKPRAEKIEAELKDGSLGKDAALWCSRQERAKPGEICPLGLAILQADEETDTRLLNKIVITAKEAGFYNLLFAVKNK